jgi:hypothetical protein
MIGCCMPEDHNVSVLKFVGHVPMSVGRAGGFLLPFGSNGGERDCLVILNS